MQFHRFSLATIIMILVFVGTYSLFGYAQQQTIENDSDFKGSERETEEEESIENDEILDRKDADGFGKLGEVEVVEEFNNGTTSQPDLSSEEWVMEAVLDVAYYLRSHKFNDFDRRYYNQSVGKKSEHYHQFPSPPLRYMHWEVYRYCDRGFYACLAYLHSKVGEAVLTRSADSCKIVNDHKWEYPQNAASIETVEKECVRLRELDLRDADPFKGPLERFQWRASASYFMCHFTMLEYSPLIMFGERCDNYANCLMGRSPRHEDPRANDSLPFQCAMYSFCPDICCHKKLIANSEECWGIEENPCGWQTDPTTRRCGFNRESNQDFESAVYNEWNVTCHCDPGYVWESMFGFCVDIDECSTGTHTCTPTIQTCLNLKGGYGYVCSWGYINVTGSCLPNDVMTNGLAELHMLYHKPQETPLEPFSFIKYISGAIRGMFSSNVSVGTSTEHNMTTTVIPLLDFNELLPS